jgi:hypothetical protein
MTTPAPSAGKARHKAPRPKKVPPCKCGAKGQPDHTCPYATEINEDDRKCNCCDECAYQCAMDI